MTKRTRLVIFGALVIAALAAPPSWALDPKLLMSQYIRQVWQVEDGLPSSIVFAITQTEDGYLWLGTSAGVVRFDGSKFQVFDRNNTKALVSNTVWALASDPDGSLWVGTAEGLARVVKGEFVIPQGVEALPDRFVQCLLRDRRGRLWIGTNHGLAYFEKGRFVSVTGEFAEASASISSLFEDRNGAIWMAAGKSIVTLDAAGHPHAYGLAQGVPEASNGAPWQDHEGRLWIGSRPARRLENGRFVPGPAEEAVMVTLSDRSGNLWLGTRRNGLKRVNPSGSAAFSANEEMKSPWIEALFEDREGSLWVGTVTGGLVRIRDPRLTPYGTAEGLPGDVPRSMVEDDAGALWTETNAGSARFAEGRWRAIGVDGGRGDGVRGMYENGGRIYWNVRDDPTSLHYMKEGRVRALSLKVTGTVWAIAGARGGGTWVGAQNGLFRLVDERFEGTAITGTISDVVEEPDGTLWAATPAEGLIRLRGRELRSFTTRDGLPTNSINQIYRDSKGTLWLSTTDAGLVRLHDGRFRAFGAREGVADSICKVVEDRRGNFWMSSSRGIFRASRSELDEAADGAWVRLTASRFDAWDGLRSTECTGSAIMTRDGRLWFTTTKGVVTFEPDRLAPRTEAWPIRLEQVRIDEREATPEDLRALPAGVETVELTYATASLGNPERIRFRYKLEGYDADWQEAGTRRVATYRKLPHGSYAFHLRATNEDGVWSEDRETLPVVVAPHLHETWWARSLGAVVFLGGVVGFVRLRLGALKRRARDLEERRLELTKIVDERTEALTTTVAELRRVQEQLSKLSATSPEKLENVGEWSAAMAIDIANTIGARQIGIWSLHGDEMRSVSSEGLAAPTLDDLAAAREAAGASEENPVTAERRVVPVHGMSGQLRGALVILGAPTWGNLERQLVLGFAHHLGSALELRGLREQLTLTERRQAAARMRMREEGTPAVRVCRTCQSCFDEKEASCPRDGSPLDDSLLLPYRVENRYRLVSILGEGAMGSVFRAEDEKLQRDVALKLIRAERLAEPVIRFRVEREARTLAQIRHPSVAALFDSGELADGSAFLVMELLIGRNVADLLKRYGRGSAAQVGRLLQHAGAGLAAAHRAGVIHRDIKPANLVLIPGPAGFETKVVDFGLATSLETDSRLTQTGTVVGTPAYMSPEQAQGLPLDLRSDLYSLAAVGYEALTGEQAIPGNDLGMLVRVLYSPPSSVSSVLPQASSELDAAFASALAKRPAMRPSDIEAWTESVARILSSTDDAAGGGWPETA